MNTFKIIFAGTPQFAVGALEGLIQSRHEVVAVYTQPDRPAGRGRKVTASPVKEIASSFNIPVYQPTTLSDKKEQEFLADLNADVMVVAAYGLLLPKAILHAPRFGCINIHASLLPRWRGAAPIQNAILAGDPVTGISIMQMTEGLDQGPVFLQVPIPIHPIDTSQTLEERLAFTGPKALLDVLDSLESLQAKPQDPLEVTYAGKIKKESARINWKQPAIQIERQIRAYNPWPISFAELESAIVRIWSAVTLSESSHQENPGKILQSTRDGIDVATANGVLRLLKIQLPGGKVLPVAEILHAHAELFSAGKQFSCGESI
jgi:methionyl-tRNA formyltransferase